MPTPSSGLASGRDHPSLDAAEWEVLRLAAVHRFVRYGHIERLLEDAGVAAAALPRLLETELLERVRLLASDYGCLQITRTGLQAVGCDLPLPTFDLGRFRHDAVVPALWVAAARGELGPVERVWTARELAHREAQRPAAGERPLGIRVPGDRSGRPHYSDLVLVTAQGLVALTLELGDVDLLRAEALFRAYGGDPRWRRVVSFVEDSTVGEALATAAANVGLSDLVGWQRAALG